MELKIMSLTMSDLHALWSRISSVSCTVMMSEHVYRHNVAHITSFYSLLITV